jgi:iron complex transport system substrate-binding protein
MITGIQKRYDPRLQAFLVIIYICSLLGILSCQSDSNHQTQSIGDIPTRIISASPNITEIIAALGKADRLVAITDYCTYPPEIQYLPRIGGFVDMQFEKIIKLKPDLVILLDSQKKIARHLHHLKIPVLMVSNNRVEEILDSIAIIGNQLQAKNMAEYWIQQIRQRFPANPPVLTPDEVKPKVLILIHREEHALKKMMAVGVDNYLNDIIEAAGGINLMKQASIQYPEVSITSILASPPDIIIETRSNNNLTREEVMQIKSPWLDYSSIPAVRNNKIYVVGDPSFTIPSHRIIYTADTMKAIIQGDSLDPSISIQVGS